MKRLWDKVAKSDGCWHWTAAKDPYGYGRFQIGTNRSTKTVLAHRLVYEVLVGPIPDGMTLDHLCRNTSCVRPDHLEPITSAENVRRAAAARPRLTHCKRGHEYKEGSYVERGGSRHCKECGKIRQTAYRASRKEAR